VKRIGFLLALTMGVPGAALAAGQARDTKHPYNVLLIMSDDLTTTALSCYGNTVCQTPNIDRLAARGMLFTHAYCQGTYCGPSRASFMSGYYPHATGELGYRNPRKRLGDRAMWPELFKNAGYYTARVSKIFHMGVPGDIERGSNGADDPRCWTERFNSPGPEWKAPGDGENLERNPDGKKPLVGGNNLNVVEAFGGDLVHSDGKTAEKACELIEKHKNDRFWLGVGFVRPHVPFVAPASYFKPFKPYAKLKLPEQVPGDWEDIPKPGINYKNNQNMQLDLRRQKKALGGYYAAVRYMDAQVGKVLDALEHAGLAGKTIVIFTTDHGYHLDEHGFWEKVSLHEESAKVPLIISVPGKKPGVCDSLVELLDLFPTTASLCGFEVPKRLQGKDLSPLFDDPTREVREAVFDVAPMRQGFLLRTRKWAYIQYGEDAAKGIELYDMETDPHQFTNLAGKPEYAATVASFKKQMAAKLCEVRDNDLGRTKTRKHTKKKQQEADEAGGNRVSCRNDAGGRELRA
jgi:iduronate 2-sulfatase